MPNLIINGTEYSDINNIKIPTTDGNYALYRYFKTFYEGMIKLKSLKATGTQYINTLKKMCYPTDVGYEFYLKFAITDISKTMILFGEGKNFGNQLVFTNGKPRFDRTGQTTIVGDSTSNGTIHEYKEINGTIYFDDSYVAEVKKELLNIAEDSVLDTTLFAKNTNTGVETTTISYCDIYEFYYKEGGEEIVHLYPVLDSEGVPCMYDGVRKIFLYNSGSGVLGYEEEED